ncbi:MAG: phospho-sugar mutase [Lachnospiraceae bacterium]|nr:phospho-sugar mutase [Lachnospiraceae bacterium]
MTDIYLKRADEWADKLPEGDPLSLELERIRPDEGELKDRFSAELKFGTAGLRGKTGVGTNRMNRVTVGRATRGLGRFICDKGQEAMDRGVVIARDPRHFSDVFEKIVSSILSSMGIKCYVFPGIRPTPELAFLIRHLNAVSGVNVTASHNPRDYNGYKVYWDDGCQISGAIADCIAEKIGEEDYFPADGSGADSDSIKGRDDLVITLGSEYDRSYLDTIKKLSVCDPEDMDLTIPLVYTPLNGAGSKFVKKILSEKGFTDVNIVGEQEEPDPDFTTAPYPNPEFPEAFRLARELGKKSGAVLLMATDPDSDRFAAEIPDGNGDYIHLNGNQTGYLLVRHMLESRKKTGTLPQKGAIVRSIVTSPLTDRIAEGYGVKTFETLTGFKNICGKIPALEKEGYEYIIGFEESAGYAASPLIRDKDGVSAGLLMAESAAACAKEGRTLSDALEDIYRQYGYCSEIGESIVLEGLEGSSRIRRMMAAFREKYPGDFAGFRVLNVTDYSKGYEDIPPSDVLRFKLENGSVFFARPSGTEPKIKFYFYSFGSSMEEAASVNNSIKEAVLGFAKGTD